MGICSVDAASAVTRTCTDADRTVTTWPGSSSRCPCPRAASSCGTMARGTCSAIARPGSDPRPHATLKAAAAAATTRRGYSAPTGDPEHQREQRPLEPAHRREERTRRGPGLANLIDHPRYRGIAGLSSRSPRAAPYAPRTDRSRAHPTTPCARRDRDRAHSRHSASPATARLLDVAATATSFRRRARAALGRCARVRAEPHAGDRREGTTSTDRAGARDPRRLSGGASTCVRFSAPAWRARSRRRRDARRSATTWISRRSPWIGTTEPGDDRLQARSAALQKSGPSPRTDRLQPLALLRAHRHIGTRAPGVPPHDQREAGHETGERPRPGLRRPTRRIEWMARKRRGKRVADGDPAPGRRADLEHHRREVGAVIDRRARIEPREVGTRELEPTLTPRQHGPLELAAVRTTSIREGSGCRRSSLASTRSPRPEVGRVQQWHAAGSPAPRVAR